MKEKQINIYNCLKQRIGLVTLTEQFARAN